MHVLAHQCMALLGLHKSRSDRGAARHQQEGEYALVLSRLQRLFTMRAGHLKSCFKNALAHVPL